MYRDLTGIEIFPNVKVLILDHNNMHSLTSIPKMDHLETLSLSYNAVKN